ncbi:MAG: TIGR04086 family membrane protein [Lachnospiraceae bacterium]|nr:TIGR04086 family membrane protein [Lachnospiraceae bacterium]
MDVSGMSLSVLKGLVFSYILTAVLLMLLAFALFKMELTEKPVAIAIIAIYVLATLFAGFVTGKKCKSRRFLCGLLTGVAYFMVLALVSMVLKQDAALGSSFFTTLALCAGGGMLGGMLS